MPRRISWSVLILIVLGDALAVSDSVSKRVLPSLDSTTTVSARYIPMTDESRLDPFSNGTQPRQVMITLFYPTIANPSYALLQKPMVGRHAEGTLPYMPPTTATLYDELLIPYGFPSTTLDQLWSHCYLDYAMPPNPNSYPLVVFSPGGGAPRFFYTTILQDMARKGFVVAAVDHPHDALVVEFPEGEIVLGLNKTLTREELELLIQLRARDLSFVIDQLGRHSSILPEPLNTTNVVAIGHSLGGATVAEAMLNDTRIIGGINLDGRLFGSMERGNTTLSRPFLQFASEESTENPWARWDEEWQRLGGWKLELFLTGAAHSTFTDFPLIAETYRIREKLGKEGEKILGTVKGMKGLEIVVEYLGAFARFVLTGSNERLLQDETKEYPEVHVKRRR